MKPRRFALSLSLAAMAVLVASMVASANGSKLILSDPFTMCGLHRTVVEPDTYSAGSTIVAVAQTSLFSDGGATDIGFATSTNNGASWTSGVFPGITICTNPPGPYARVSDPSVAFDARHNVWIASSLAFDANVRGAAVLASRSTTGGISWNNPVNIAVASAGQDFEKNWSGCDNSNASPFYGSCYTQFDDFGNGNRLKVYYSRDGGLTWAQSRTPKVGVIGGQPVVQGNGTAIMPIDNATETALGVTISTNGGASWSPVVTITPITAADDPGNIRSGPLPSAEIDGGGRVFVTWEDCRFRVGCYTNDLVYTTSTNGTSWTAVQRIPIDAVNSAVDHFIPGIGVDKATMGSTAHVSVTYYFFPNVSCTEATCQLFAGSISSSNGGATWSAPVTFAGPMTMSWLPNTTQGRMVGDYISTSFAGDGSSHGAVVVAKPPPSAGTFDVALYDPPTRFKGGSAVASDPVVAGATAQPGASAFKRR